MTEGEWLTGDRPEPMLEFLRRRASDRKLRLFACGCARQVWTVLWDGAQRAVEVAERYADGAASRQHLSAARRAAWKGMHRAALPPVMGQDCGRHAAEFDPVAAARDTARVARDAGRPFTTPGRELGTGVSPAQCQLLRELFGNPFRPVAVDSPWLTSTVSPLSRGIYEERAFDRLPILADALQDAGCEDEQLLDHCRSPGPHARGCWVVDLVLGKG